MAPGNRSDEYEGLRRTSKDDLKLLHKRLSSPLFQQRPALDDADTELGKKPGMSQTQLLQDK